jgi:hypothetical protein
VFFSSSSLRVQISAIASTDTNISSLREGPRMKREPLISTARL